MTDDAVRLRGGDTCSVCNVGVLLVTTTIGAVGVNPDQPVGGSRGLRCTMRDVADHPCGTEWIELEDRPGFYQRRT
jgi:hypothetical protein